MKGLKIDERRKAWLRKVRVVEVTAAPLNIASVTHWPQATGYLMFVQCDIVSLATKLTTGQALGFFLCWLILSCSGHFPYPGTFPIKGAESEV